MRSRPAKITAIAFGIFVFLGISALLAKALSGAGNERAEVLTVLEAQARGDADEVLERLDACRRQPVCVRLTRARVAELKRPGQVQIVRYDPSIQVALTRQAGTAQRLCEQRRDAQEDEDPEGDRGDLRGAAAHGRRSLGVPEAARWRRPFEGLPAAVGGPPDSLMPCR